MIATLLPLVRRAVESDPALVVIVDHLIEWHAHPEPTDIDDATLTVMLAPIAPDVAAFLRDRRGYHHLSWYQTARSVGTALNALYYMEIACRREQRPATLVHLVEQAALAVHADVAKLQPIPHHDRLTEPVWITQNNAMVDAADLAWRMLGGGAA